MALDVPETPPEPRQRTLSFYLVFLAFIVPLSSTLPASWFFVIYALLFRNVMFFSHMRRILFLLALCEVLFSIHYYHLSRRVAQPAPCGAGDPIEIQAAYSRLLKAGLANLPEDGDDEGSNRPGSPQESIIQLERDDPRAIDFRNCLRNWFRKVPFASIRLHEVQKWLYWSIYNADLPPLETLSESHHSTLHLALDLLQKRSGWTFQQGSNSHVQPMRITIDDINLMWRPLTYYLLVHAFNLCLKHWYMAGRKVEYRHYAGLEYLLRMPRHWDPVTGSRPLVFIHGLGLGLLQYHTTIVHLFDTFPDRPVLVLLQPHISQDIFHPKYLHPMTRHQMADRLAKLFDQLGWVPGHKDDTCESSGEETDSAGSLAGKRRQGITMLSHSNGSYIHAWMLKGYPKMIARSCFIDPVTFCSWEGDVCYNFVYRPCKTGLEILMRYFVGAEIGVANLLQRHFDWTSNSLWYEDIPNARDPNKTFFVLGGNDAIIHAERVRRYLTSHGVKKGIWYDPNGRHGQALLPGSRGHVKIFKWLQDSDAETCNNHRRIMPNVV